MRTLQKHKHKNDPTLKDIGFMLPKLLNNDWYDNTLESIKGLIVANPDRHICVFCSYNERIDTYNVPVLHLNESKFFYGNLFMFDITSIVLSHKYPNLHNRYWYTNETPWTSHINGSYQEWKDIFMAENLNIIVQNESLNDIYSICWKNPIGIMEKFNHESVTTIL